MNHNSQHGVGARRRHSLRLGITVGAAMLAAACVNQPADTMHDDHAWYEYAAKFVCGRVSTGAAQVLNTGRYFTAVNVHNPDLRVSRDFFYKVAVALPAAKGGPITGFDNIRLDPDEAVEIDCPTIMKRVDAVGTSEFRKGFVVIVSREELDVVGVYTAGSSSIAATGSSAAGTGEPVQSIHIEPVEPRWIEEPGEVLGAANAATACVGAGCCCNSPSSLSDPNAPPWPDCTNATTQCVALQPGGVLHPATGTRIDVNVCMPRSQPLAVPFVHSSQPPFCRNP